MFSIDTLWYIDVSHSTHIHIWMNITLQIWIWYRWITKHFEVNFEVLKAIPRILFAFLEIYCISKFLLTLSIIGSFSLLSIIISIIIKCTKLAKLLLNITKSHLDPFWKLTHIWENNTINLYYMYKCDTFQTIYIHFTEKSISRQSFNLLLFDNYQVTLQATIC